MIDFHDDDYLAIFGPSWDKLSKFDQLVLLAVTKANVEFDELWYDLVMTTALDSPEQQKLFMACFSEFMNWLSDPHDLG